VAYSYDDLPPLLTARPPAVGGPAERATQTDLHEMRSDAVETSTFVGSVSLGEALELYSVVRDLRPTATLEIGMLTGASTLAILKALSDAGSGEHYVCDPFQSTYARSAGLRNVRSAGLDDRLHFHEAFPESCVPDWPAAQFAFIDGSHLFDLTILDFVLVDKRLEVGGLVGFHDMWMPALQKVVRWAVTNRAYVPTGASGRAAAGRERAKGGIARLLRRTPRAAQIWSQELLHPWHDLEPSGAQMVFLRKTREDERDWRDYAPF
jgi:predicted O-methyltransferase YrrM